MTDLQALTFYELLGEAEGVTRLVHTFYPIVLQDEELAPLFAESNIDSVMEKQVMFLTQFFGGPLLFTEAYGHPMMRARHMHFALTPELASAWLRCMKEALVQLGTEEALRDAVIERLSGPAYHFVNTP
ncbi:globin [Paenibacillus swuensis]|uniref:Globin n=1 Tax=Paenibacillus swuensis TaxID=1178515 RepID=A0A172TDQ2_9BACL|nr:globin [Paenibacillus swuensis]ANE45082.1 globin [Paenibacillus swuensis]